MPRTDILVIGAGVGGLSAAALLSSAGRQTVVLEQSSELGGCAGKFDRGSYRFAAGATVGMGFEPGGVLERLFRRIGEPLPAMKNLDIIMDVHLPDQSVRYYRDADRWLAELSARFPEEADAGCAFFREVWSVDPFVRQVTGSDLIIPPVSPRDFAGMASLAFNGGWRQLPYLAKTVGDVMKKCGIREGSPLTAFINGQLIDSVQTTADRCPALLGMTALNVFHQGAFYVYGGLAAVSESLAGALKRHGGDVLFRQKVISVRPRMNRWEVRTAKGEEWLADQIVYNGSLHSLPDLMEEDQKLDRRMMNLSQEEELAKPSWGAFTVYAGGADVVPEVVFHQFIGDTALPLAEGNQFLCSFSAKDDQIRAPEGQRVMTISTHTDWLKWKTFFNGKSDKTAYQEEKAAVSERIWRQLQQKWPAISAWQAEAMYGTPYTFQRYTARKDGRVGGYIPQGIRSLFDAEVPVSRASGFWVCGDTVYPGAGTLGASLSGQLVAGRILN